MIQGELPEVLKKIKVKISVIVPVYNAAPYLEACIQCLLSQNFPEQQYEVIMIDNNSTDGSGTIIQRHPDVQYLKEERHGSYFTRNTGIITADGDILAFTDADCVPSSDWLRNIEAAMSQPDINIALGHCQYASDSGTLSLLADYENAKAAYAFSSKEKSLYYAYTNNMAVRRQLFNQLGLFLEIPRGADVVFVRRVLEHYPNDSIRYFPDICVRHLEVSSPLIYFMKQYVYGKSYGHYHQIVSVRALNTKERLRVFKSACRTNRIRWLQSCILFALLVIGGAVYELGRMVRRSV